MLDALRQEVLDTSSSFSMDLLQVFWGLPILQRSSGFQSRSVVFLKGMANPVPFSDLDVDGYWEINHHRSSSRSRSRRVLRTC